MMSVSRRLLRAVLCASLSLIAAPAAVAQDKPCPKIVGGCAAGKDDWPSMVALRLAAKDERVASYFCGGTVIAERWVLTAAHCLQDFTASLEQPMLDSKQALHEGRLQVVLGATDLGEVQPSQVFAVERIVIHETYRAAMEAASRIADAKARRRALDTIALRIGYDIALLRLDRPAPAAAAVPLALSAASDPPVDGVEVRVAGFGLTEHNMAHATVAPVERRDGRGELVAGSASLRQTLLPTVSTQACKARYPKDAVGEGQICAGLEEGGRDSCQGDSGGPLMAGDEPASRRQVGIVSWGMGCARKQAYSVYTRVSHFGDWIQKHTGQLRGAPPFAHDEALTPDQIGRALAQLEAALGPAKGRARIGVRGGNKVKLGDRVVFEAESSVGGRLLILDINAKGKVTLLYPNKFVVQGDPGQIRGGDKVAVPGPSYRGFTSFEAQEPLGVGRLIAIVAPEGFDIERFAAGIERRSKGFTPVNDPPKFLMQIIRQIEAYLGFGQRAAQSGTGGAGEWGYAITEYEIAP